MTRIRSRIRERMDEIGMTGRELARQVRADAEDRERDSWISGILKGASGLHWKHFDAVCDVLDLSPSELVRHDDAELRELTPSEMRLLRRYQEWPPDIRDRWLSILDHFSAQAPDKDTATLLDRLRSLPRSVRRPVLAWLFRLLEEGIPPEALTGGVAYGAGEGPTEPTMPRPNRPVGKRSVNRKAADDPKKPPPTADRP